MARNEIKAYTHTLRFWKISEWYTKKRIKNALEIATNILNDLPLSAYFWLNTNYLRNFRPDGLSHDKFVRRWLTSKTKKNFKKTFLQKDYNTKFQLYFLKVSSNAKIVMQCLENFGGRQMSQIPSPPVARLLSTRFLYQLHSRFWMQ